MYVCICLFVCIFVYLSMYVWFVNCFVLFVQERSVQLQSVAVFPSRHEWNAAQVSGIKNLPSRLVIVSINGTLQWHQSL